MLKDVKTLIEAVSAISPNGLVALALVVILVAFVVIGGFIHSQSR